MARKGIAVFCAVLRSLEPSSTVESRLGVAEKTTVKSVKERIHGDSIGSRATLCGHTHCTHQ